MEVTFDPAKDESNINKHGISLPQGLQDALSRGKRGPQKAPTKTLISLRLSQDVLAALRATGKGRQSTVDETLRREFVK